MDIIEKLRNFDIFESQITYPQNLALSLFTTSGDTS